MKQAQKNKEKVTGKENAKSVLSKESGTLSSSVSIDMITRSIREEVEKNKSSAPARIKENDRLIKSEISAPDAPLKEDQSLLDDDFSNNLDITWGYGIHKVEKNEYENWRWCSNYGFFTISNSSNHKKSFVIKMEIGAYVKVVSRKVTISGDTFSDVIEFKGVNRKMYQREIVITPNSEFIVKLQSTAKPFKVTNDFRPLVFTIFNFELKEIHRLRFAIKNIPILGKILWWPYMFIKAPTKIVDFNAKYLTLKRRFMRLKKALTARNESILFKVKKNEADLAAKEGAILKKINGLESKLTKKYNAMLSKMSNQKQRLTIEDKALIEKVKELEKSFKIYQENMLKEDGHLFNDMYVDFENQFRGAREDIKNRVAVYIPYIKEANAGTEEAPVLDVGCGRGELLELLKENNYVAKGIDINRQMILQCKGLDLDIIESDVIEYLKSQPVSSFGAITGIHIIEHLKLNTLIMLLDESLRVLKPGGVLILETPNPDNIIVGACYFYIDPTHQRPIPPATSKFLLEARGFKNVEVCAPDMNLFDTEKVLHRLFGEWGSKHPDYAIIGWKANTS